MGREPGNENDKDIYDCPDYFYPGNLFLVACRTLFLATLSSISFRLIFHYFFSNEELNPSHPVLFQK